MNTYLWVCGIILHVLALLAIIAIIVEEIRVSKYNKKMAAEKAKKEALYKEELKLAKPVWQAWAKKMNELQKNYDTESNPVKRLRIDTDMVILSFERCHLFSGSGGILLRLLGEENGWTLQE